MRLQTYLVENQKDELIFIKKRLILFIDDIEHNIKIMRQNKIKDGDQPSLNKIYKEIESSAKAIKKTINKVEEMFDPDVMSKNVIRIQIGSIERNLQTLDDRLNKGV